MTIRRLIRKAVLAWQSWRFRRKHPALAAMHAAENAARARRCTQDIHRARKGKRKAILDSLRSAPQ